MRKLTNKQKAQIQGGVVTWEEYCETVHMIADNNPDSINNGTVWALTQCQMRGY